MRFYVPGLYAPKRGGKWAVEPLRAEAQVDGECGKAWRLVQSLCNLYSPVEARKKGVCFSPHLCFASVCDMQSEGIVYAWIGLLFMTRSESGGVEKLLLVWLRVLLPALHP